MPACLVEEAVVINRGRAVDGQGSEDGEKKRIRQKMRRTAFGMFSLHFSAPPTSRSGTHPHATVTKGRSDWR